MADKIRFILSSKVAKEGIHSGCSEVIVKIFLTRTVRVQVKSGVFTLPKHFGGSEVGIVVPNVSKQNLAERREVLERKEKLTAFWMRLSKIADEINLNSSTNLTREFFLNAVRVLDKYQVPTEDIQYKHIGVLLQQEKQEDTSGKPVQKAKTVYELAQEYLDSKKDVSSDFKEHINVILRCMYRYEKFCQADGGERKHFKWDIHLVTREDIEDFWDYLKDEHDLSMEYPKLFSQLMLEAESVVQTKHHRKGVERRGTNTIIKILKRLKAFFNWLNIRKYTSNQPFNGIVIGSERYGVPFYLTIDERNKLADFDLSARPALAIQRDIFVFHCLVGCRIGDLTKFTPDNITNGILEYVPMKTRNGEIPVKPRVPLNARAQALINKYKGVDTHGRLFPFISDQNYNEAIKDMLKCAGIDRIVPVRDSVTGDTVMKPIYEVASSHMARRTFIGAAYKKVKDPNLVGRMSGHAEGSRSFTRYRDIDDDDLRDVINMID